MDDLSAHDTHEITLETKALYALGGLSCAKCDTLLPRKKPGYGTKPGETTFECCGVAYCPYCGERSQKHCHHLVAMEVGYSNVRFYGFAPDEPMRRPESFNIQVGSLLEPGIHKRVAAFRTDVRTAETQFCNGDAATERHIAENWLVPNQMVERGHYRFYFSDKPDEARQNALRMLRVYQEGIATLRRDGTEGTPFIAHSFPCYERVIHVSFVDDAKKLLVHERTGVEVFDLEGRQSAFRADIPVHTRPARSNPFSNPQPQNDLSDCYIEVRRCGSDELVANVAPDGVYSASKNDQFVGGEDHGVLLIHGYRTVVAAKGYSIHLYDVESPDNSKPARTFHTRCPVTAITVAPDGETFATVLGSGYWTRYVIVWRVPRSAVCKESNEAEKHVPES